MRTKVVTSLSAQLWTKYAEKTLATWVDNFILPEGSEIEIWIMGPFPTGLPIKTKSGTPIYYKSIDVQSEAWQHFFNMFKSHPVPETPQGQEFRYNFLPFSVKVFALAEASMLCREAKDKFDTMLWLDADVSLRAPVTGGLLDEILAKKSIAWLDRGPAWDHCGETGFILARNDDTLDVFLTQANIWGSGQLFFFREWHDAFTFSSCIRYLEYLSPGVFDVNNLNKDMDSRQEQGLYPFKTSVLNKYFDHHKGALKNNA